MASRYWVGGGSSSYWDATGPTNWGTASNTQDNASVPGASDNVYFDGVGTGACDCVLNSQNISASIDFTGYSNWLNMTDGDPNSRIEIHGSLTLSSTMTISGAGYLRTLSTGTITCAGKTIPKIFLEGTYQLGDAFSATKLYFGYLSPGTLTTNNYSVTYKLIAGNTATLTAGTSTITQAASGSTSFSGTWSITGTPTFRSYGGTFDGNGMSLNNIEFVSGTTTLAGSNTWNLFTIDAGSTVSFTAGTTQTVTTFTATGTAGSGITINSTSAGSAATLSQATGTVNADYCSIKDSTATGGATWNATNSTNVSGNSGWIFAAVPIYLNVSDSFSASDSKTGSMSRSLSDTQAMTDSLTKAISRALSDTQDTTDSLGRSIGTPFSDTISSADSIARDIGASFSDTISSSDSIAKAFGLALADAITAADSKAGAVARSLSDTATLADTLGRAIARSLTDAITSSDTLGRGFTISLSDIIASTDTVTTYRVPNTYLVVSSTGPDILDLYVNGSLVGRMSNA